ncbi:MAG TPA: sugar ABC transporter substrate-binding protein [Clostridiales bacterium]|nr:sugar ABC transporter substrate-binding protein [Clostridiales bacterium]
MDSFAEKKLTDFMQQLASSAPFPGGGGAAALSGAMGAALGCMVCRLTLDKPSYEDAKPWILGALEKFEEHRAEMLALIDGDAAGFESLSKAWAMARDDPARAAKVEGALCAACGAPIGVIDAALQTLGLLAELAGLGIKSAISDVGVAAELCKAAIFASKQTLFINAALMKDKACAAELREKYYAAEARCMAAAEKAVSTAADRIG